MRLEARDRAVVVGKTGMGKSHYTKALCASELEHGSRLLVFDPFDEYSQLGKPSPEIRLGPLTQRCTVDELVQDPRRWLDRKDLALAVVSEGEEPDDVAEDFVDVARAVAHTGNMVFVIEEVGYFGEHCQARLKTVATMYRHYSVAAVFVAQRAVQVPLTARSQASQIVAFQQDEQQDLDALELRCGRYIPDIAERVARLQPGHHVHWRADMPQKPPTKEVSR